MRLIQLSRHLKNLRNIHENKLYNKWKNIFPIIYEEHFSKFFLFQGYSGMKFVIDFNLRNATKIPIRCTLALLFLQLAYICQAMF